MSFGSVLLTIIKDTGVYWKTIVLILTPLLLLPLPLVLPSQEANCGYALLLMAVYWITEALPLPVTALLPLFLFPILGILTGKTVASLYIADSTIVFLGGLFMALAIEKCNLHKRIGLGILVLIGTKPTRLLIGFMLPTWFLSMWISNTATTAMMIPVAEAVVVQLREGVRQRREKARSRKSAVFHLEEANRKEKSQNDNVAYVEDEYSEVTYFGTNEVEVLPSKNQTNGSPVSILGANRGLYGDDHHPVVMEMNDYRIPESSHTKENGSKEQEEDDDGGDESDKKEEERIKKFARMLCLAVAYSSNVGGTATLTGTPTNLLVAERATIIWESHGLAPPLTYTTWLFFGFPHAVLCLILTWAWLQFFFMGWRPFCFCCVKDKTPHNDEGIKQALKEEYDQLGRIGFGEISSIVFLIILVVLWFSRDPGFAPGYASLFPEGYVTDAVPAILISTILFAWPSEVPKWICLRPRDEKRATRVPALLDWPTVCAKLPWGPIFLLGGGFALAAACDESGLSELIGQQLAGLSVIPPWAIALIITILVSFVTEITSNSAVISLMLPILEAMANDLGINPLYLMLPAGMAASYAFMLPIATPPNAIVFSYGHLKIFQMASVGFAINILCILVVTLGVNTWGMALFNLDEIPWDTTNSTVNAATTSYPLCQTIP